MVKGVKGRDTLLKLLGASRHAVDHHVYVVYQTVHRTCHEALQNVVLEPKSTITIVVVTSVEILMSFTHSCQNAGWVVSQLRLLVVSGRVAAKALALGYRSVYIMPDISVASVVQFTRALDFF